jgi:hypothetical protein
VRFAPDLFVVLEAEPGERTTWVVNREGRTLDFVLEVHAQGDKDLQRNVARFAELGIPEYVVYDAKRHTLTGYRLEQKGRPYLPVMQQGGRWRSEVLGLWLGVREGRLRFFDELHVIPFERELNVELQKALADAAARAETEAARAETEAARAETLEAEVARLRALLGQDEPGQ